MFKGKAMIRFSFCVVVVCALPFGAAAQSFDGSFDGGGSFDDGGNQIQPSAPATGGDTTGSEGFGGNFDGGSFDSGGAATTQPVTPAPSPGGDDFSGGSFDTVQPGPATPQPQPQPVTPEPSVPSSPNPGIQVDPQIYAFESRDFGVPPTSQLRNGQLHGATPTAIPGGQLVSTEALANALNQGMQIVLIDVLGGQYSLPGANVAPGLAQPGNFNDRTQQQASQWLRQITGGNPSVPIVTFCSDPQCWMSYNAALRTINAGYTQVYWYRGGLQAWQMGGLPMQPAGW